MPLVVIVINLLWLEWYAFIWCFWQITNPTSFTEQLPLSGENFFYRQISHYPFPIYREGCPNNGVLRGSGWGFVYSSLINEKFLADAFFCPPSLEGGGPLAVEDFFILYAFGDPLLSTSDKSGQKRLSAHFAISKNISLRSILVKFEAEPNFFVIFNKFY